MLSLSVGSLLLVVLCSLALGGCLYYIFFGSGQLEVDPQQLQEAQQAYRARITSTVCGHLAALSGATQEDVTFDSQLLPNDNILCSLLTPIMQFQVVFNFRNRVAKAHATVIGDSNYCHQHTFKVHFKGDLVDVNAIFKGFNKTMRGVDWNQMVPQGKGLDELFGKVKKLIDDTSTSDETNPT